MHSPATSACTARRETPNLPSQKCISVTRSPSAMRDILGNHDCYVHSIGRRFDNSQEFF